MKWLRFGASNASDYAHHFTVWLLAYIFSVVGKTQYQEQILKQLEMPRVADVAVVELSSF